jgi:hypothetical protein
LRIETWASEPFQVQRERTFVRRHASPDFRGQEEARLAGLESDLVGAFIASCPSACESPDGSNDRQTSYFETGEVALVTVDSHHPKSRLRQYQLANPAKAVWRAAQRYLVIDDDLGISGGAANPAGNPATTSDKDDEAIATEWLQVERVEPMSCCPRLLYRTALPRITFLHWTAALSIGSGTPPPRLQGRREWVEG